jgi:hypothetical protein
MYSILKKLFPLFLLFTFSNEYVSAIPAFGRKYGISCKTCHSPSVPKLKDYGDQFAGDGFTLEDYEAPRYTMETGDQKLSMIRDFPLAVRLDGYITFNFGDTEQVDFAAPYLIKLMSGGELSEHLAYYFYFYMDERGEIAGVEDAYLMYNNLFDQDLDIYLGQFQVSDPLFKRELRLSLEDYHVYTTQIGLSDFNMKYDKGIMITYGLPTGTDIIFEVVNGNGLTEANEAHLFDKDKYKNVLGRISQGLGDYVRLGAVGYYGKESQINNEGSSIVNEGTFAGVDATIAYQEIFEVNFQYLYRNDSKVFPSVSSTDVFEDVKTNGILGEAIFSPQGDDSDWYLLGLLNLIESDYNPADYSSISLHTGYLLRRNVRLAAEYSWIFTDEDNPYSIFSLGFTSAF